MVKNPKLLEKFNCEQIKKEKLSYLSALKIFEALWKEGVSLGVLPLKDPMEGIEVDIKIAKVLNSCLKDLSRKSGKR
jgi:hypothetical protein